MIISRQSSVLLGEIASPAIAAAAVFDVDGTLVPNTGHTFYADYYAEGGLASVFDPHLGVHTIPQWFFDFKGRRKDLQDEKAQIKIAEAMARRDITRAADRIYTRAAEELAWHRANLHPTVLVTGAFMAFAAHDLDAIDAEFIIANESFVPMLVNGQSKPALLQELFDSKGFNPHSVYTDHPRDLPMLEGFAWDRTHIVCHAGITRLLPAIRGFVKKAEKEGWHTLKSRVSNQKYPEALRLYARNVIKGKNDRKCAEYYMSWHDKMTRNVPIISKFLNYGTIPDADNLPMRKSLANILVVAGLLLNEKEDLQNQLVEILGEEYFGVCLDLYQQLVTLFPDSVSPLEIFMNDRTL